MTGIFKIFSEIFNTLLICLSILYFLHQGQMSFKVHITKKRQILQDFAKHVTHKAYKQSGKKARCDPKSPYGVGTFGGSSLVGEMTIIIQWLIWPSDVRVRWQLYHTCHNIPLHTTMRKREKEGKRGEQNCTLYCHSNNV